MNFDNQGIVWGIFLRQRWVLLLVDGAIYFTETYYKIHCITMGCTIPLPSKISKSYKNKYLTGSWSLNFGGKGYKIYGLDGHTFIGDGYFYIGSVVIQYFYDNFWL